LRRLPGPLGLPHLGARPPRRHWHLGRVQQPRAAHPQPLAATRPTARARQVNATVAQLRGRLATVVAELIRAGWHVDEIPQALTKEQLLARVLEEERRCRVMQEAS